MTDSLESPLACVELWLGHFLLREIASGRLTTAAMVQAIYLNRALHLFGWVIVLDVDRNGRVLRAYPARAECRGFSEADEAEGFVALTKHLRDEAPHLAMEVGLPAFVPNRETKDEQA